MLDLRSLLGGLFVCLGLSAAPEVLLPLPFVTDVKLVSAPFSESFLLSLARAELCFSQRSCFLSSLLRSEFARR